MRSAIPLARERCLGYRFFSEPPSRLPAKRRTEIRLSSEDTHTLTLDGKVDDIVLQGLNPYNQSDGLITDIRQLSGKATRPVTWVTPCAPKSLPTTFANRPWKASPGNSPPKKNAPPEKPVRLLTFYSEGATFNVQIETGFTG